MLHADPRYLLLGDLSVLSHQDRARVFDAIVALAREGVDSSADWQMLRRLDSDLIVERIAPLLRSGAPWEEVRLALSVANACEREGLNEDLLGVAENTQAPVELRALALNAVVGALPEPQIVRLRALVADEDPDVAAHAIDLLWPDHLSVDELLASVPVPRPNYLGPARMLLQRLPNMLGDGDWLAAVRWARAVLGTGEADREREPVAVVEAATDVLARAVSELAATGDSQSVMIDAVADALLALVGGPYKYSVEAESRKLREALGASPTVRRAIARAVLGRANIDQIFELCSHSSATLFQGSADSAYWAVQWPTLPTEARALMQAPLFHPPTDVQEWSEAYEIKEQHADLRELIEPWFLSPSPPENWMRDAYYARLKTQRDQQTGRNARRYDEALLHAAIDALLTEAGDVRAMWRSVLLHLHRTTEGDQVNVPDRLDISGAPHFPATDSPLGQLLLRAAAHVLRAAPAIEVGHIGEHGVWPWQDAPELYALTILAHADQPIGPLDAARWAGLAIALLCSYGDQTARDLRRSLFQRCAAAADGYVEQTLPQVLERLNEHALASAVEHLPTALTPLQQQVLLDWALELGRSIPTWALVLRALARRGSEQALAGLRTAVAVPPSRLGAGLTAASIRRWLAAADVLTRLGDAPSWTKILNILDRRPQLAESLMTEFVQSSGLGSWPLDAHQISTRDLARLYTVMADHVPMPADFFNTPSGFVGRDQDLLHLHQALPVAIHARGGTESLDELRCLATRYPDRPRLRARAAELALHVADQSWRPPATVKQLVAITTGRLSRVVHNEFQLRDVVVESLRRLQTLLQADNGWATALWNQKKERDTGPDGKNKEVTLWWPTWENDLSDFVTTFLRNDLADRAVVINREVEVTRPSLKGGRTDIQVQAALDDPGDPEPLTVIIETKGCWNDELPHGLADQLIDKYLLRSGHRSGIYLIGYFDDSAWLETLNGQRGRKHKPHTPEEVLAQQQAIAEHEQREKNVGVVPFVLDCRLPAARLRQGS